MTREEAIEVLKRTLPYESSFAEARSMAIRSLEADVRENKHGEWIKIHWKAFRCSVCKWISEYYTDFCPNCGADMREVEE